MKRLTLAVLCAAMLLSLCACDTKPEPTEPLQLSTEAPVLPESTQLPAETPEQDPTEASAAGQELLRNADCAFTVTGIEMNEHLGLQIHVLCENLSERTLMFTWNHVSVCGFMIDPMWALEVKSGQKLQSTVGIDTYVLEQMGVAEPEQVEFTLQVQDSEEFMNAPVAEEVFCIYPTGKSADQVVFPEYTPAEGHTVIVDGETLTFVVTEVDDELADYYTLKCYIANRTDRNLLISLEDVTVNGFVINPFWAVSVAAGKQAYSEIIFYRSELEQYDIEVVQEIEWRMLACDTDDFEAEFLLDRTDHFRPVQ